jgi:hypothetical protein
MEITMDNRRGGARRRLARVIACVAGLLVISIAHVGAASAAGSEQFMTNMGLGPTNAYASGNAHAWLYDIWLTPNPYRACPAVASGYGGYTSTPNAGGNNTAYQSSLCAVGYAEWYPNPVSGALHGAVYNNSGGTTTMGFADAAWQ